MTHAEQKPRGQSRTRAPWEAPLLTCLDVGGSELSKAPFPVETVIAISDVTSYPAGPS